MKKMTKEMRFRVVSGLLIAISALLLPGAIAGSGESESTKAQMAAAEAISSLVTIADEFPEAQREGFAALADKDPLFMLQINSQRYDNVRTAGLKK